MIFARNYRPEDGNLFSPSLSFLIFQTIKTILDRYAIDFLVNYYYFFFFLKDEFFLTGNKSCSAIVKGKSVYQRCVHLNRGYMQIIYLVGMWYFK